MLTFGEVFILESSAMLFFFLVYSRNNYMDIVAVVADNSMQSAVEEVKALPEYSSKGEVRYCTVCIYLFMSYSISVGDN